MKSERSLESLNIQIEIARDLKRAPQFRNRLLGRKLRSLVEPFRHQQFGAGADRSALALHFDLGAHEQLRRGIDDHGAEPERPDKAHRAFEKFDVPHGDTWRHDALPQSSAVWVKKCLRMRCTSSVKAGSAMASSERGRGSGTS